MPRLLPILTTAALLATATSAAAQEGDGKLHHFGDPGFVISADRLLPMLSYQSIKTTQSDGSSQTQSRTSIALLNNGPYSSYTSFYNLPRIGFDWIPFRNLTLGGTGWIYTDLQASDSASDGKGTSKSTDQPKVTYWGVAPRVGYVIPFNDMLYLWPRAGVEYFHVSSSDVGNGSTSVQQLAVSLEAMLVISPWRHFGFMVGPNADLPLSGKQTTFVDTTQVGGTTVTTTQNLDSAMWQVGVTAGLLGHF